MANAAAKNTNVSGVAAILIIALLFAMNIYRLLDGVINYDIANFIAIAIEHVHHGAVYYDDILEFNPPMFMWIGELIVRLADVFHVSYSLMTTLFFSFVSMLSLALTALALRQMPGLKPILKHIFLVIACFTLTLGVGYSNSQREFMVYAAVLPYIAWWWAGNGRLHQVALASIWLGFALVIRPPYVLIPIMLALYDVVRTRSLRPAFSPQHLMAAAAALLTAAAFVFGYPGYWQNVWPLLQVQRFMPDRSFLGAPLMPLFTIFTLLFGSAALSLYVDGRRHLSPIVRRGCFGLAMLVLAGFITMIMIGIADYRLIPYLGGLALLNALMFAALWPQLPKMTASLALTFLSLLFLISHPAGLIYRPFNDVTGPAIGLAMDANKSNGERASRYMVLTNGIHVEYYIDSGLQLVGLANSLGAIHDGYKVNGVADLPPDIRKLSGEIEQRFLKTTLERIKTYKPELLIVEFFPKGPQPDWWPKDGRIFNFASWLCQDDGFAKIWPEYEPVLSVTSYTVYKRRDLKTPSEAQAKIDALLPVLEKHEPWAQFPHVVTCDSSIHP